MPNRLWSGGSGGGGGASGSAGGDLTGTYPNPTLAVDRVKKTGDTMSGVLLLPDGSASAPALANDGDSNTGVFFGGAGDQVDVATGGTSRIQVGTTTETHTLPILGANGSASATAFQTRAAGNGMYSSAASTLDLASGGSNFLSATTTQVSIPTSRLLRTTGGLSTQRLVYSFTQWQTAPLVGDPVISTGSGISDSATSVLVDDGTLGANPLQLPRAVKFDDGSGEWAILTAISTNTYTLYRGALGTTATAHSDGCPILDSDSGGSPFHNFLVRHSPIGTSFTVTPLTGDIDIWTPPRASLGTWSAPPSGSLCSVWFSDANGYTVSVRDPNAFSTLATFTNSAGEGVGFEVIFDASAGSYAFHSARKET